ncbi:MAG TPA: DMT family transporter [Burkholderiaceae bacterium]|nr:DMT family transporter [Burkholderiaceae bacterium]
MATNGHGIDGDSRRRRRIAEILLWVTPLIWSSNYIIARAARDIVPPNLLAFGRWSVALAVLLPFNGVALARSFGDWRGEWWRLLVLGALGMWICGAFVYIGARATTATNIALIYAAAPVGIAVLGHRLLGERATGAQRFAMGLAVAGVLCVIVKGDPRDLIHVRFNAGDPWILVAGIAWIAYSVLQRLWSSTLPPSQRLTAITAGGLLVLLPFTIHEAIGRGGIDIDRRGALLIVMAGLLPGALSYQAYLWMQRELGATRAGLVMYLAPVYSAFTAWWLLDEPPRWFHAVGAALILPGIFFATRDAKPPPAAPERGNGTSEREATTRRRDPAVT